MIENELSKVVFDLGLKIHKKLRKWKKVDGFKQLSLLFQ